METEIYVRSLEPFERVRLTPEEFVLVKAIVYMSAGTKPLMLADHVGTCLPHYSVLGSAQLSPQAKHLLAKERERYAQLLLRHLQRIHGPLKGASRYAEVISLVEACFHFARKYRDHFIILTSISLQSYPQFALTEDMFHW